MLPAFGPRFVIFQAAAGETGGEERCAHDATSNNEEYCAGSNIRAPNNYASACKQGTGDKANHQQNSSCAAHYPRIVAGRSRFKLA